MKKLKQIIWLLLIASISFITVRFIESSSLFAATLVADLEAKRTLFITQGEFAEFMKGLKNFPDPANERCFSELSGGAAAKAICSLKEQKLLEGIATTSFREKKLLKMKDFVGMVCRAEHWITKENPHFKECLQESRERGLFGAFGKSKNPFLAVRRKHAVTFLKILRGELPAEETNTEENTDQNPLSQNRGASTVVEEETVSFTPVFPETISKTFFDAVTLDREFPNTFFRNEIYHFRGEILGAGNFDQIFVFLIPAQGGESVNYLIPLTNRTFDIPVVFRKPGNYQLGIIPGVSGKSKVVNISILDETPEPGYSLVTPPAVTQGLDWKYEEGEVRFFWPNRRGDFVRLTFQQGTKKLSFFSRSFLPEFDPETIDFKNFQKGRATVTLEFSHGDAVTPFKVRSPWVKGGEATLSLIERPFRSIQDSVTLLRFDEILENPGNFSFSAKVSTLVATEGAYINPQGEVHTFPILKDRYDKEIPVNTLFSVNEMLPRGTTIFEVNDPDGSAVVNAPVFVAPKTTVPLLPDYFALNAPQPNPGVLSSAERESGREEVLGYINEVRRVMERNAIRLDTTLSNFAQAHCDDMKRRNFFSHYNPDGKGPNERRLAYHIDTSVRENLAKSPTLRFGHEGLVRSPIHLEAMLERRWTRVGIGISKNEEGAYNICEEFTTDSLTEDDLRGIETSFFEKVNQTRQQNNLSTLALHGTLQEKAREWSQKMADGKFFGFKAGDGTSLLGFIRSTGLRFTIQSYILEGSEITSLERELLNQPPVREGVFQGVGIGVAKDENGLLKITSIYHQ